ncbi:unnamed protein product [Orchesella dallaii]|uniref:Uncharacterized protein n=1 Tax=Orchesella dallaii TaxID=48710 RepID=A0ABP1RTN7_9HEXA
MDLPPLSVPIITQRMREGRTYWTYNKIYLPIELPLPLELQSKDGYIRCPFSNYFQKCEANISLDCDHICTQIDLQKFTLNTKPWNCEAEIVIRGDPKSYYNRPHIFNHDWIGHNHETGEMQINPISQMIPTYQSLKILIVPKTHVINGYGRRTHGLRPASDSAVVHGELSWLYDWFNFLFRDPDHKSGSRSEKTSSFYEGSRVSTVARYLLYLFCTDLVPSATEMNITTVYSLTLLYGQYDYPLSRLVYLVLLSEYTKTVSCWNKNSISCGLFVDVRMLLSEVSFDNEWCTTHTCYYAPEQSSLKNWEGKTFSKTSDNLLTAYVQLWSTIFKNQTVGVTSSDKVFTSCISTWRCLSRVTQDFWKKSQLGITLGITHGFGLSGEYSPITVINSKYSLGFVCCGLPPQSSLAFKDLVNIFDLVEDKFQIFTRMFSGEAKLTNARGFTQVSPHNFAYSASFDIRDQKKVGISEIAEIVKDMTKHNISLDARTKFSTLYKHSKLHTFMMEDLSRLSVGNYDFKNSTIDDFQATESDYFFKSLETCGRTAVVLPLKLAYEHFQKLKKGGKATVYFGKEILHKRNLGFYFEGWLPEYAVSGIKGISQSGIWNRLYDIYGVSHKNLWLIDLTLFLGTDYVMWNNYIYRKSVNVGRTVLYCIVWKHLN